MDREMPMDRKIKHLEFIQGVINRLASDSFRMKGWCVVLVAALFILLARQGQVEFVAVALIPVIAFWGLDGYFLWQERLYRALYDHVRTLEEGKIDFSMNVSQVIKKPGLHLAERHVLTYTNLPLRRTSRHRLPRISHQLTKEGDT